MADEVIPAVQQLLAAFRALAAPVVFTAIGTEARDGSDLPRWIRSLDDLGRQVLGRSVFPPLDDPSWAIDEAVAPRSEEAVLNKRSAGTFATTDLEERLRRAGVESVVVCGVTTEVCVSTTAREAADRGLQVIIAGDACTAFSQEMHQASLDSFNLAFGPVRTVDEIVALLGSPRAMGSHAAAQSAIDVAEMGSARAT